MKRFRGYTLIELLIVISIITTLVAFGTGAYYRSQQRHAIRAATDTLVSTLQSAHQQALIGKRDCTGATQGHQVTITSGSSTLTLTALCTDGNGTPQVTNFPQFTFSADYTFTFQPLTGGIDLGPGITTINLDYLDVNGDTHRIVLTSSGTIEYLGIQ